MNLGSGPKLLGSDFTLTDPKHRWFDRFRCAPIPGATSHRPRCMWKPKNRASTISTPTIATSPISTSCHLMPIRCSAQGIVLRRAIVRYAPQNRRALARHPARPLVVSLCRMGSRFELRHRRLRICLRRKSIPGSQSLRDSTDLYRGGIRFEKPRFHVTLEEGGTSFKSDQSLFQNPGSENYGNVSTPVFGQTLI